MVDILIIADLYSVSISLWNSFLHDLSRISSILIVSNHLEAINIIDTKNIDIIVLDLNTLDENNYSIIDYILSNNIEKFYKCFLVFNNCNFSLDNFSSYIYNFFYFFSSPC